MGDKLNYKRLGNYIQEVDVRNENLLVTKLLGLTINKEFIPSVANIIGTDMSKYKIINKDQFACSTMQVRRDGKMPIALLKEEKAIISQAYPVFEIIDKKELLPDYLMMWFSRSEFDREACFYAVGGVRGSIEWEDFLNMQLPIPSIEKQQEVIAEYNALQKRIDINKQLIQHLEDAAQAIYKQWFVNFEFPNEEGKAYKSSGGKIKESELGMIPAEWDIKSLSDIAFYLNGLAMQDFPQIRERFLPILKIRELSNGRFDSNSDKASHMIAKEYIINNGDVIFSWSGTLKVDIWCGGRGALNQHLFKVFSTEYPKWFYYIWTKQHLHEFIRIAEGKATSLGHIKRENLSSAKILIPTKEHLKIMNNSFNPILEAIIISKSELTVLHKLTTTILSKMSTINNS